jgi:hypothetical protein
MYTNFLLHKIKDRLYLESWAHSCRPFRFGWRRRLVGRKLSHGLLSRLHCISIDDCSFMLSNIYPCSCDHKKRGLVLLDPCLLATREVLLVPENNAIHRQNTPFCRIDFFSRELGQILRDNVVLLLIDNSFPVIALWKSSRKTKTPKKKSGQTDRQAV